VKGREKKDRSHFGRGGVKFERGYCRGRENINHEKEKFRRTSVDISTDLEVKKRKREGFGMSKPELRIWTVGEGEKV